MVGDRTHRSFTQREKSLFQRPFPRAFSAALFLPHICYASVLNVAASAPPAADEHVLFSERAPPPRSSVGKRGCEGGRGGEGAHLCFMPLYLLQMFSDTINSAVPFSRPLGQFLSPGSTLLALLGSASCRRPRLRFHELDYIQLTSVNCTHFVNRRSGERDVDAASSSCCRQRMSHM